MQGKPDYQAIECLRAPQQGRSGGGLFTPEGILAGVSNYAEPAGNHGLYASPSSIYRLLGRNGLSELVSTSEGVTTRRPRPEGHGPSHPPAEVAAVDELEALVGTAREQLGRGDRPGARTTITRLDQRFRARREALQAEIRALETTYDDQVEELRRAASDPVEPTLVPEPPLAPTRPESAPSAPVLDQERRLQAVEQKLEQILQAIEGRGQSPQQ